MIQLIKATDYKKMPWKNGLGTTQQIAIFPEGADISKNDFLFRLSAASIHQNNQFSQFPSFQRLLTVIDGAGVVLNNRPLKQNDILEFEGEEEVDCRLVDGPVTDLGLIFKKDQFLANFAINELDQNSKKIISFNSDFGFLFSIEGKTSCSFHNQEIPIQPMDTLQINSKESIEIQVQSQKARLVKIELTQKINN